MARDPLAKTRSRQRSRSKTEPGPLPSAGPLQWGPAMAAEAAARPLCVPFWSQTPEPSHMLALTSLDRPILTSSSARARYSQPRPPRALSAEER